MTQEPQDHTVEVDLRKPKTIGDLSLDVAALVVQMNSLWAHMSLLEDSRDRMEGPVQEWTLSKGEPCP